VSALWRDVNLGLRMLWRRPAFTAVAIVSLVLGIGINTALFTLVDALFLNPLPHVDEPDRLVAVYHSIENAEGGAAGERNLSYDNYLYLREKTETLSGLALSFWQPMNVSGGDQPDRVSAVYATPDYFTVLGIEPEMGSFFTDEHHEPPTGDRVLVLGHSTWQRLFAGDSEIVGRKVELNGRPYTVLGITPRGFNSVDLAANGDVFIPLLNFKDLSPFSIYFDQRGVSIFRAIGRLAHGVSREEASAEIRLLSNQLAAEFPSDLENFGGLAKPLAETTIRSDDRERYVAKSWTLGYGAALVFLIACLNVAGLLAVRGAERKGELALRRAVGAQRGRLLGQLLAENLVLFTVAGLLSLPVARWALDLLWAYRPPQFARDALTLQIEPGMTAFALALALAGGLLFGLLPALGASKPDLVADLKDGRGRKNNSGSAGPVWLRPRGLWVSAQLALALVALIAAGLFIEHLRGLRSVDLGFTWEKLAVLAVSPGDQNYDEARGEELYREIRERLESLGGVEGVGLSENRLMRGATTHHQVFVAGSEEATQIGSRTSHRTNVVAPGFFKAVGIPLLEGEDFRESLPEGAPPRAIVNETMARTLWPGESAIGKTFHFDFPDTEAVEVIGVVGDAKYREIDESEQFFIYVPLAQNYSPTLYLHARAAGDPSALLPVLRREIAEIDPQLAVFGLATMAEYIGEALWLQRVTASALSLFGLLALVLSAVGIYGVISYWVSQRRHELAIRSALGAQGGALVRAVYAEAFWVVGVGLVLGVLLAFFGLEPVIGPQLGEISAFQPTIYAAAVLVLLAIAALACWQPARRARRAEPASVLRSE